MPRKAMFDSPAEYRRAYNAKPEVKAWRRAYSQTPEAKAARQAYRERTKDDAERKAVTAAGAARQRARIRALAPNLTPDDIKLRVRDRMYYCAKHRAKARGLPFDLNKEDIICPTVCPLLGVELAYQFMCSNQGKPQRNSASLDRIDCALGYVKGNIQVISHRANALKNDATLEELERLVINLKQIRSQV